MNLGPHHHEQVRLHWDFLVKKYADQEFRLDTSLESNNVFNDAINLAKGVQRLGRSCAGWNAAIDAVGGVLDGVINGMKAHTNDAGMVTGADFFATELTYLEPVVQMIRELRRRDV